VTPAGAALSPSRLVLENGVVVTTRETRKTPAVTINLALRAGSMCDPLDAPGAIYLLSRLIDRGTAHYSAAQIAETLEDRGISLAINVNRHILSAVCTCLSEDFEVVAAMLAAILTEPSLPEAELATRKGEVVTAIAQDEDSPYVKALERLLALLYGADHPYGRPAKGTPASIEALTRERMLALHHERFAPSELSAVIVGDVESDQIEDVMRRLFGDWGVPRPAAIPLLPPTPPTGRRRLVLPMMNKVQADIAYGFTTIRRDDPSYYACSLMNNILGQYAMGGRLGDSIRERQGMAYYVSTAFDAGLIEGPLMVRAGVSPANVDRAIQSIDEELTAIRKDGVTEKELAESRQYLIGSMPRALETNGGIANFLQNAEFFGLGPDFDVRLPDYLRRVTLGEVNEAARKLMDPERATVVIAGPYQQGE
jgi:zinc protease